MKFFLKLFIVAVVLGGMSVSTFVYRTGAALEFAGRAVRAIAEYFPGKTVVVEAATQTTFQSGEHWQGKVVGVSDGDTITVMHDGSGVKIRLYGVDTPESHQDFGQKAKRFTSDLVFGKTVEVRPVDTDRYGRMVGEVFVGGGSLNGELVRAGLAWVYRQYCKTSQCSEWSRFEDDARKDRRGFWSVPNPTPPWEYRKENRTKN